MKRISVIVLLAVSMLVVCACESVTEPYVPARITIQNHIPAAYPFLKTVEILNLSDGECGGILAPRAASIPRGEELTWEIPETICWEVNLFLDDRPVILKVNNPVAGEIYLFEFITDGE